MRQSDHIEELVDTIARETGDDQHWPIAPANAPRRAAPRATKGQRQDSDNAEKNEAYKDKRKWRQLTQRELEDARRESPDDNDEHETKVNSVWLETAHSLVLISTALRRLQRSASIGDRSVRQASDSKVSYYT